MSGDTLIAGLGNIFFGDDGFGVEVVGQMQRSKMQRSGWPAKVQVKDFGIRSVDLAFALEKPWDLVVLVDVSSREKTPGTLTVLDLRDAVAHLQTGLLDGHTSTAGDSLRTLSASSSHIGALSMVACEPVRLTDNGEPVMGLSEPVAAAVPQAIDLICGMLQDVGSRRHA